MFKKKINLSEQNLNIKMKFSIFAMTGGVIVAGFGDLKFELNSYVFCGMSTLFHALALSFIQKCGEPEKDPVQTFYLSSLFSLPFLITAFFLSNEPSSLAIYLQENSNLFQINFQVNLLFVIMFGCFLSYSQFWCTTNNNAITTSVIGVLKSFIQTIMGIFVFEAKNNMSFLVLLGIFINLIFGTWYTYLKYIEKEPFKDLDPGKIKKSSKTGNNSEISDLV